MRVIFAGSPDFAATALRALAAGQHDIVAVYSQPDRPAGRGRKLTANAVKQTALELGLTVEQPLSLRDDQALATLQSYQADVMVVAAYGLILPQAALEAPRHGCINIHASLLPRWRGAAPIHRAILAGDSETGISIMQMDEGLDTGAVLSSHPVAIEPRSTTPELHNKLAEVGAKAAVDALENLEQLQAQAQPQDNALANYANKLTKDEATIDWGQPATVIDRQIRALLPWPVAQTTLPTESGGKGLRIWAAEPIEGTTENAEPGQVTACDNSGINVQTGNGQLRLTQVQAAGKKQMNAADFARGIQLVGQVLGK